MVVSDAMRIGERFLAVDWGTTNRRVYLIEDGVVIRSERDDRGVKAVAAGAFPAEVATIRDSFGDLPMLLAGMVGSTIGWQVAPYVPAPAGMMDLACALSWVDERTAIVPGVSSVQGGRGDVMRGEEVQLLGAVAAGLAPPNALLAQPGTHCKWVSMEDGRIAGFTTAMTGELFAMLRGHSILAPQLGGSVSPGDAFREGVEHGKRRDLAADLFGVRAAAMLNLRDDADAASYVSGLLIGSDVAARLADSRHDAVHLLADPVLGALYTIAIEANGREAFAIDSHAAFVAGIVRIGAMS
ncbi:2-dehydro-3-deoxygalactonokinase [Sphingomonas gellani]|uniref:2-dehydro-3-deoxygalactonokinase n=1 Tax=Sphingomonas gellani TaxID=1166340 RepID=A0A1H8DU37_9SPHN|nr:2-dehydro-3-deoxygalactonokinase [Sphingomonas gellani]SEN10695.1 2-dehydro-3-deoxygalactonokinase [Sphingomonas gellani]